MVCMKWTSESDQNVSNSFQNRGTVVTCQLMVCALKDFKVLRFRNNFAAAKWVYGLWNGTRVPKGGFAAAKHPSKWRIDCEMEDFKAWRFRSCEMDVRGCETISQQGGDFRSRSILATKFRRPCSLLAFELLLIPNFLLSPLLTFLLILIIQKPMLHQNKLELKHWNQN